MSTTHKNHANGQQESSRTVKQSSKKPRAKSSAQSKTSASQDKKKIAQIEVSLKEAEEHLAQEREKYIRLIAEFENFKKRSASERLHFLERANEGLLLEILPVIDDLERGLATAKQKNMETALLEGFELVWHKFIRSLKSQGLEEIPIAKGDTFNDEQHEAIAQVPTSDKSMDGKIVQVIEKGYQLKNKVLRFAKVQIARHE